MEQGITEEIEVDVIISNHRFHRTSVVQSQLRLNMVMACKRMCEAVIDFVASEMGVHHRSKNSREEAITSKSGRVLNHNLQQFNSLIKKDGVEPVVKVERCRSEIYLYLLNNWVNISILFV